VSTVKLKRSFLSEFFQGRKVDREVKLVKLRIPSRKDGEYSRTLLGIDEGKCEYAR
jgi:hypothetical protein